MRVLNNKMFHMVHWPKPPELQSILTFVLAPLCIRVSKVKFLNVTFSLLIIFNEAFVSKIKGCGNDLVIEIKDILISFIRNV